MTARTCDVLVLGAGPAGCAAALVAARGGARVVVLEADASSRPVPGETLNRGATEALDELRVGVRPSRLRAVPHRALVRTVDGADARREPVTDADGRAAPGWHVERARLHDRLRRAARAAGARLVRGTQAVAVLGDRDGVRGLRTTRGEIAARWVIDASGRRQWLARHLGLARRREGPRRLVAWGYARGPSEADESRFDAGERGWTWWAPVGPGCAAWVRCATEARGLAAPPSELAVLGAARANGGADLSWRLVRPTAGSGFLLSGDAALLLDPSFGDGVERALRTGGTAARTALEALRRPDLAAVLAARYDDALVRAFEARVRSRDAATGL